MKTKTEQPLSAFETACSFIELMSFDERLGMMKLLSLSMDGPRLYTDADVKVIVQGALEEQIRRARVVDTMAHIQRKAN